MREPVELTYAKCYELLAAGGLGRAAVCTPTGPEWCGCEVRHTRRTGHARVRPAGGGAMADRGLPVRFGFFPEPVAADAAALVDDVLHAERLGFDLVGIQDRGRSVSGSAPTDLGCWT